MNYALKIAYNGEPFAGFQRQSRHRTVQGELEKALSQIFQSPIEIQAAGRTDAGVHGIGQVVAFSSTTQRPLKAIAEGCNGLLHSQVFVSEAALLPSESPFHPRYSAVSRTYSYYILSHCEGYSPTLWPNNVWCLAGHLDPQLAQSACGLFEGKHDFTTFTSRCDKEMRQRHVQAFTLEALPHNGLWGGGKLWRLRITANGFLRKMVRLLTAAVVEVGIGLRSQESLAAKLQAQNPAEAPHPAPASGLYFESVEYDPDPFDAKGPAAELYRARTPLGLRFKA